jgi:protoporphyrinogen oxidase
MYTILGAGLSGISASYHLGHENCLLYEMNSYPGGHIISEIINGFTWDEGPHVSFTKNEYVKNLFADSVDSQYLEYNAEVGNFYKGAWIPHPAQSNFYAIPQPERDKCFFDFLKIRQEESNLFNKTTDNYREWLIAAFGEFFYHEFSEVYTKKYWTVDPSVLTTDWIGERVYHPNVDEVKLGYYTFSAKNTHYITKIRYPKSGGFFSFVDKLRNNINIKYNKELELISFDKKSIQFKDGLSISYQKLISTIPLPILIAKSNAPAEIKLAAEDLSCSSVLLINVAVKHPTKSKYNWIYVYDKDKYSTRISFTDLLSSTNTPEGQSGIQVEVYFSKYQPIVESHNFIANKVCKELIEMGLIENTLSIIDFHTKWVQWANVIFDFKRREALNSILNYLEKFGLERTEHDLLPMTDWNKVTPPSSSNSIFLAGRFAEWKYYWTDDCILRGKSFI